MSVLPKTRRHVGAIAVGAVGVLALAGGGSAAYAASSGGSTPSTTAPSAPAVHGAHRGARGLLERSDHTTVEVKVKGQWVTYTIDRGKVTADSATSISLSRRDGQNVTLTVNPATKYHGVSGPAAIQTGKGARVVSQNGTAIGISQRAVSAAKPQPQPTPSP